jgi:hypothetical protein
MLGEDVQARIPLVTEVGSGGAVSALTTSLEAWM